MIEGCVYHSSSRRGRAAVGKFTAALWSDKLRVEVLACCMCNLRPSGTQLG